MERTKTELNSVTELPHHRDLVIQHDVSSTNPKRTAALVMRGITGGSESISEFMNRVRNINTMDHFINALQLRGHLGFGSSDGM